jgi:hypothetical protein
MAAVALACAQCGIQFNHPGTRGKRPKMCPACTKDDRFAKRPRHIPVEPRQDIRCSSPGCEARARSKGLCGPHYSEARNRALGVLPRAERIRLAACHQVHTCKHCGSDFKPKCKGRDTFCSRDCAFAAKAAAAKPKPEKIPPPPNHCACGVLISARSTRCKACAKAAAHQDYIASRKPRTCADCGAEVPAGEHMRRCPTCRAAHHRATVIKSRRNSPSRRADKAKRKAIARGRAPGAERFDPIDILKRDGWRCHMCGVSTPKSLRGTYDDRAPELDHIVPLAAGGAHTRANTACACRRCNMVKGAHIKGQLRLFG